MKDFWKYVFATVIGILLTATLWLLLSLCILACSVTGGSKGKSVVPKDGSVLVVKLSGQIVEHVESDAFSDLLGGSGVEQQGLDLVGAGPLGRRRRRCVAGETGRRGKCEELASV